MMSANNLFEEFGRRQADLHNEEIVDERLEDAKLQSFEQGYGAGWDDAIDAQKKTGRLLNEHIHSALAEAKMTKEEVMLQFADAIRPVFEQIFVAVLPDLANRALPDHIGKQIEAILAKNCDFPIEVRTSPDQANAVQAAISKFGEGQIKVQKDPDLAEGQAMLAYDKSEIRTDLPETLEELRALIESFYFSIREEH